MEEQKNKLYRLPTDNWNIIRMTYLIGGMLVMISSVLALIVSEKWLYFTIFVGIMLMNFSLTGYCPMAIILGKLGMREK